MDSPSPQPPSASVTATDIGLLLIRLMVGLVYLFHGSQKLFGWFGGGGLAGTAEAMGDMGLPVPLLSAALTGLAEFAGGLAVLTGVMVRVLVWPLVFAMLVASFWVHGGAFSVQHDGMEFPLTMAFVLAGLGLTGPGRLNLLDLLRGAGRPEPEQRAT